MIKSLFFGLKNIIILKYNVKSILHLKHFNYMKNLVLLEIIGLISLISFSFDVSSMKSLKILNLHYYCQFLNLNIYERKKYGIRYS